MWRLEESLNFIVNKIYLFISIYLKWVMAIKGLEIPVEKYFAKVWQNNYGFEMSLGGE